MVMSAWRRIERRVPRVNSSWRGTMAVRPLSFRSFRWLPRWLTFSEAELLEGPSRLATGDDRQPFGQALSSRVEMIGASISVGRGWSS